MEEMDKTIQDQLREAAERVDKSDLTNRMSIVSEYMTSTGDIDDIQRYLEEKKRETESDDEGSLNLESESVHDASWLDTILINPDGNVAQNSLDTKKRKCGALKQEEENLHPEEEDDENVAGTSGSPEMPEDEVNQSSDEEEDLDQTADAAEEARLKYNMPALIDQLNKSESSENDLKGIKKKQLLHILKWENDNTNEMSDLANWLTQTTSVKFNICKIGPDYYLVIPQSRKEREAIPETTKVKKEGKPLTSDATLEREVPLTRMISDEARKKQKQLIKVAKNLNEVIEEPEVLREFKAKVERGFVLNPYDKSDPKVSISSKTPGFSVSEIDDIFDREVHSTKRDILMAIFKKKGQYSYIDDNFKIEDF